MNRVAAQIGGYNLDSMWKLARWVVNIHGANSVSEIFDKKDIGMGPGRKTVSIINPDFILIAEIPRNVSWQIIQVMLVTLYVVSTLSEKIFIILYI